MELPAHWRDWGLGLELADDVSAADWLADALRPWSWPDPGGPTRVASFVPDRYEAFARILHPLRWGTGEGGRWSELAAPRGVTIGPETPFSEAAGLHPGRDDELWGRYAPSDGSLPAAPMAALGAALGPHTATPDACVFCFWVGSGAWGGRGMRMLDSTLTAAENQAANDRLAARAAHELAAMERIPLVRLPHREHYLFTGPLARAARPFMLGPWEQSPSMWWPADRSWFVATEVDGYSSYAGGSQAAIAAVLASPVLEALAVTAHTPMDPGPFR